MAISAMLKLKLKQLRKTLDRVPMLDSVENAIHVPKEWLTIGLGVVCITSLFTGYGAALVANLVGFLYPARGTFHALESGKKNEQWLTYWLLFGALTIPETYSSLVTWIPFYYFFKIFFLTWCWLPQTYGAEYIYDHILKSMLAKPETMLDRAQSVIGTIPANNGNHVADLRKED